MSDPSGKNQVETDERFPSGPWVGFWLQRGITGRQWMRGMQLRFADGRVDGLGSDCVGDFTLAGKYDLETGKVMLLKHYLEQHDVAYDGQNDADGKWVWGVWTMTHGDRGGFHLWPKGEEDPTQRRLTTEADVPAEVEVAVG
jgi:hypothetical protein